MKQITNRLYIANNISEEQLTRLSPNVILVLDSGSESLVFEFCTSRGFITKHYDVINITDKELNIYAKANSFIFAAGDKILIVSNDSSVTHRLSAEMLSVVTGMLKEDAIKFVKDKIGKN